MSDFEFAFSKVIESEGGYVNDPNDPGGETKYGISKTSFPNVDIKSLTLEQAKDIYKANYWDKIKGDQLPYPLNYFMFDCAVNQGVEVSIKLLQKTLSLPQDGILGINTIKAAQKMTKDVIALYLADRALRYTGTRNFDKYGRGWMKRLFLLAGDNK